MKNKHIYIWYVKQYPLTDCNIEGPTQSNPNITFNWSHNPKNQSNIYVKITTHNQIQQSESKLSPRIVADAN